MFGFVSEFYPEDMLNAYKAIPVNAAGTAVTVSINRYRNNDGGSHPTPADGGTQDAMKVKDALLGLGVKDVLARGGGASAYVGVFAGKGSPEAIAAVMETLVAYSDRFVERYRKAGGVQKKVADWLADQDLSWQDTLQNISNEILGLDCNGFVGNWVKRRDATSKIGPNTRPRDVFDMLKKGRRTKIEDFQPNDVVIWTNFSHIAAIDWRPAPDAPKFNICQSAGGGPRLNEYLVRAAGNGTFTLQRPIPPGQSRWDVGGAVYVVAANA